MLPHQPLWAALRFDQRIVTGSIVLMAAVAVWGAKHGYGPFVQTSSNVTLLLWMSFVGTSALMTLVVAAVTVERRRAEDEKWRLASELERRRAGLLERESHVRGEPVEGRVSRDCLA